MGSVGRAGGAFASETAVTSLVEYLAEAAGCFHGLDPDREHEFLERLESAVRHDAPADLTSRAAAAARAWPTTTSRWRSWCGLGLTFFMSATAAPSTSTAAGSSQLTRDQTMGEFMVDAGAWTEEQARKARYRECTRERAGRR